MASSIPLFFHLFFCFGAHGSSLQGVPIFSNMFHGGAVLQRKTEVSVWGTMQGGSAVTLYVDGVHVADAMTDKSGDWIAKLPKRAASFNNILKAVGANGSSTVKISFGDVILCSGQSNMGMPVANKEGAFQADNGTAETKASSRYTGGIWLWAQVQSIYHNKNSWSPAGPESLFPPHGGSFSAVCWYSGKNYFDRLGGKVPVGLIEAAVGGSPIEYWLSKESLAKCEIDKPPCDTQWSDSVFYDDQIVHLQPYTFGALVWDQAERDLKCNHVSTYPCMERELIRSWRAAFNSPHAAFVVVQLPDYYDPKDPGAPGVPGFLSTAEGLFEMRLAQEAGVKAEPNARVVVTYDQSCNNLAYPKSCPFGSVHNIHKQHVGERVAAQLVALMLGDAGVSEGPRAQESTAMHIFGDVYSIDVRFAGGSLPFYLGPTRNCTTCCHGNSALHTQGDFDASHDGVMWAPGKNASMHGPDTLTFQVQLPRAPSIVRYTAGSNFTQCALYNKEAFPAWPFKSNVTSETTLFVV